MLEQYEVALLDFARWLCRSLWGGPVEAWFLEKCDALLAALEGEAAGGGAAAAPKVYGMYTRALGV